MLIDVLLQHIMEESAAVKAAPLIFVIAVLIGWAVIFLVLEWFHREKVSSLEQRLASKETEEWFTLFTQREILEEEVLHLKLGLPLFRIRQEGQKQVVGMDEHDVKEEQIKRKEKRITELTNMMAHVKSKP